MIDQINKDIKILCKNIVIVDGYSAVGKGVFCKYLQSFNNIEKMCVDHIFHEIAFMSNYKLLQNEIADYYFKLRLNIMYENSILARDLNFRPFDDSSIFNSKSPFDYIMRLFKKDGENVFNLINKNNPHFLIMSHFSMPFLNFFFNTLGNNLKYINIVKHPVYCYGHWVYLFQQISKKNTRIYKFLKIYKNKKFFWFEDPKEVLDMNITERFMAAVIKLNDLSNQSYDNLSDKYKKNYKKICFEKFIMQTDDVEKDIINFTNLYPSKKTPKIKKKLFLNEKIFSDRTIKRTKMGFKLNRKIENQQDFEYKLSEIKLNSDKDLYNKFLKECSNYETGNNFSSIKTYI